MAATKFASFGSTFSFGAAAAPPDILDAATLLGEVTSISGPNMTLGTVDVTDTATTNYKEWLGAGIPDGGEISGTCAADLTLVDAAHGNITAWRAAVKSGIKQVFNITAGASTDEIWGACYATGLSVHVGDTSGGESSLTVSWSLKVTGGVTLV